MIEVLRTATGPFLPPFRGARARLLKGAQDQTYHLKAQPVIVYNCGIHAAHSSLLGSTSTRGVGLWGAGLIPLLVSLARGNCSPPQVSFHRQLALCETAHLIKFIKPLVRDVPRR